MRPTSPTEFLVSVGKKRKVEIGKVHECSSKLVRFDVELAGGATY
jgi:hypothetical protein